MGGPDKREQLSHFDSRLIRAPGTHWECSVDVIRPLKGSPFMLKLASVYVS